MTLHWSRAKTLGLPGNERLSLCPDCGHPAHADGCVHTIRRREFDGRREYVCACGR